jgi:AcrR family transcriptional regulator
MVKSDKKGKESRKFSRTREEILKTTLQKLHRMSYHSITYEDISKELGLTKQSINYYFPSKADLGYTVLHDYHELIIKLIKSAEETFDNSMDKLESYFGFFVRLREKGDRICIGGVLTIEFNTLPLPMQKELHNLFSTQFDWLIKILREGKEQEIFNFQGTPEEKAVQIESTVQGGLIMARLLGDEQLIKVINEIKNDILAMKISI